MELLPSIITTSNGHGASGVSFNPDVEITNQLANKGIWPTSRVRKARASTVANNLYFSIEVQNGDSLWIPASDKSRLFSPQYPLMKHSELMGCAHEVAEATGLQWTPQREVLTRSHDYVYCLTCQDLHQEVKVGDTVEIGLMARQSFKGRLRPSISIYYHRLVCENGMITKEGGWRHTFNTEEDVTSWKGDLEKHGYELRHVGIEFDRFIGTLRRLTEIPMTYDLHRHFLRSLIGKDKHFPTSTYGEIMRRYYETEEPTAFGLLNACTYVTWHRGDAVTANDFKRNALLTDLLTTISFN